MLVWVCRLKLGPARPCGSAICSKFGRAAFLRTPAVCHRLVAARSSRTGGTKCCRLGAYEVALPALPFELDGTEIVRGRVTAVGIVEWRCRRTGLSRLIARAIRLAPNRLVFGEARKLSVAALSQTLPIGSSSRSRHQRQSAAGLLADILAALGLGGAAGHQACRGARSPFTARRLRAGRPSCRSPTN